MRNPVIRRLWRAVPAAAFAVAVAVSAAADGIDVTITYLGLDDDPPEPLSLVEPIVRDEGIAGAELGLEDNVTTGRFLDHRYALETIEARDVEDLLLAFTAALETGERLFVADLEAEPLLALAELADPVGAILLNARAQDDELRGEACRASIFHVMPSRAMKADALAQFLGYKRWSRWYLVHGSQPADLAMAEALRNAARKFGQTIVGEREYDFEQQAGRTETGHTLVQAQLPVLTQNAPEHDIVIVADESEVFGEFLPFNTWTARPVAGTQGLVPSAWHRSHEQWGGTQLQRRFERRFDRPMRERDHTVWLGMRVIGEAVTRTETAAPEALRAFMLSDDFNVAAFRGQPLSFRPWDRQLRQPILLTTARMLVSVSPQEGYLHQRTALDTLGADAPETRCPLPG